MFIRIICRFGLSCLNGKVDERRDRFRFRHAVCSLPVAPPHPITWEKLKWIHESH
jgi:hypothetical protein